MDNVFEQPEERISELEDRTIEIIQFEDQKEKKMKKSECRLRDLSESIKGQYMYYGSPRRRGEKEQRDHMKKKMTKTSPT